MSHQAVRNAVWDFVRGAWGTKTLIVEAENDPSSGPPNMLVPWMTISFWPGSETQRTLGPPGTRCYREYGSIAITVFVPSGEGTAQALSLAEDVRDMMRGQRISDATTGQEVQLQAVDPPNTALPSEVQGSSGNWFGYECNVEYYSDILNK